MGTKEVIILTHENGRFATKFIGNLEKHEGINLDVGELKCLFEKNGYQCTVSTFVDLDKTQDYKGVVVLYASSEDPGKFYKGFIEDIILNLENEGAIVIPAFEYLHAHANKVYQELLRMRFTDAVLRQPASKVFGSYEEVQKSAENIVLPCVIKTASGSGSNGVYLAHNRNELLAYCKKLMKIRYIDFSQTLVKRVLLYIWRIIKKIIKHRHAQPISESLYTNKIIVQSFIPGLEGDYKVLFFQGRYYILHRKNRADDFRASGSGLFDFPTDLNTICNVLDLAKRTADELCQPIISMDIVATSEGECRLIEYQCVYFGPLTMQYSEYYYVYNGEWKRYPRTNSLEEEYCRAVCEYVQHQ